MREQIITLEKLQNIDSQLREIEKDLDKYPKEISAFNDELEKRKDIINGKKENLKEIEDSKTKLEQQLKDNQSVIKKAEERLFEIKTHKEYEALQKEITETKRSNSEIEDQILNLMEESEKLGSDLKDKEEKFSKINDEYSEKISEYEMIIEDLENSHKPIKEEKNKISGLVDPEVLPVYEKAAKRNGEALALAENESCTTCHIHLPPQLYNELLTQKRIILCPSCKRILYTAQEQESE